MEAFLEYIMVNYTWILGAAIIILLAIIGSYADKTNFGQGKEKEKSETLNSSLDGKLLSEVVEQKSDIKNEIKKDESFEKTESAHQTAIVDTIEKDDSVSQSTIDNVSEIENKDGDFEKFDEKFKDLIPKKQLIDDQLLDEIDNLSLEKTQKFKFGDIPDLDDIELPEIKSLNKDKEDIWKF